MNLKSASLREGAVILAAAVFLGLAFNAGSPLGVPIFAEDRPRFVGDGEITVGILQPPVPGVSDPSLRNETIAAVILTDGAERVQAEAGSGGSGTIRWPEVKSLLATGGITLVDARSSHQFESGHIPGAVSLPFSQFGKRIAEFASQYPKTRPLVVYCGNEKCGLAQAAAAALQDEHGYVNVRLMPGGYTAWVLAESKKVTTTAAHR